MKGQLRNLKIECSNCSLAYFRVMLMDFLFELGNSYMALVMIFSTMERSPRAPRFSSTAFSTI